MHSTYATAAPRRLHTNLPGPSGTQACLALYDVCPHATHFTHPSSLLNDPYMHRDLPSIPFVPPPRNFEYTDNGSRSINETTGTMLLALPEPRFVRVTEYMDNRGRNMVETARSTLSSTPASLVPVVLLKHSPNTHHTRELTTAPPLRSILKQNPSMPTIYLLTFSTDRTPTTRAFAALLNEHLPLRVPLWHTIDAGNFRVPPPHICENYSGVSGTVQDVVLQDTKARREIYHTVDELTRFAKHGGRERGIAICCTAGTHRSVAIAEVIARGVREEIKRLESTDGVKVVVRHVHRIKGRQDPY